MEQSIGYSSLDHKTSEMEVSGRPNILTVTDTRTNNKGNAASPGPWVVNAKGPGVQGHLLLHRIFKDTLG